MTFTFGSSRVVLDEACRRARRRAPRARRSRSCSPSVAHRAPEPKQAARRGATRRRRRPRRSAGCVDRRRARRARCPGRPARTPAASSARSTSKRYQLSSQATAIVTTLPSVGDGRTATIGAPSERATPATVRGCSERVEEVQRARQLQVGVRRDGVDAALLARGLRRAARRAGARRRGGCGLGTGSGSAAARRRCRRPRRGRPGPSRAAARPPPHALRAGPASWPRRLRRRAKQPARAALARSARTVASSSPSRIQPSWAARAVHSSQTIRRAAGVQEDVGVLAAQQRAAADVAGHDRAVRRDRLAGHATVEASSDGPIPGRGTAHRAGPAACRLHPDGLLGRLRLLDDAAGRGARAPPRSAGTPSCSRPGRR